MTKAHFTVSIGHPGKEPAFLSKLLTKGQATKDNVKMPECLCTEYVLPFHCQTLSAYSNLILCSDQT